MSAGDTSADLAGSHERGSRFQRRRTSKRLMASRNVPALRADTEFRPLNFWVAGALGQMRRNGWIFDHKTLEEDHPLGSSAECDWANASKPLMAPRKMPTYRKIYC